MNATTSWEYKVVRIKPDSVFKAQPDPEEIEEQLNRLGREGWELVSVFEGPRVTSPEFCLKRPA